MRRVGLLFVAAAAAFGCFVATGARPALATVSPPPPYMDDTAAVLEELKVVLADTSGAGGTGPPTPTLPGETYPDAWNEGAKVTTRARMAGRFLPGLRVLGTIGMGVTAFEVGWKIGTATYLHFNTPPAGSAATSQWSWQWTATTAYPSNYCPGGGENVGGNGYCWKLHGFATTWGVRYSFIPGAAADVLTAGGGPTAGLNGLKNDAAAVAGAVPFANAGGRTVQTEYNPVTPTATNGAVVVTYTQTDDGLAASLGVSPTTDTVYNSLPSGQKFTTAPYTQPTKTTADITAARTVLGDPVAGRCGATYCDAAGHPLTTGQVVGQMDTNCKMDASYCAGGAHDPTAPGGPVSTVFTMPTCVGALVAVCIGYLDAAGHYGTRVQLVADIDGAVLTQPAGAIITQSTGAGVSVSKGATLTFTRNPDPLPLLLPQPLGPNETYIQWKQRLLDLGYVGVFTDVELDPETAAVQVGPKAPVRVKIGTTTVPLLPGAFPTPAPRITPTTDITVYHNPDTVPPVEGTGAGPTCSCPPIDFAPITDVDLGDKFPFAIFGYVTDTLDLFDVTPTSPRFNIFVHAFTFLGMAPQQYKGDLDFLNGYMGIVRGLMAFALWIGTLWYFGARLLGFKAAGDMSDAAEDGSVY